MNDVTAAVSDNRQVAPSSMLLVSYRRTEHECMEQNMQWTENI